jgi:hypothetical protein
MMQVLLMQRILQESSRIKLIEPEHWYVMDGKRYESVTGTLKKHGYIRFPEFKDMTPYLQRGHDVHKMIHYDADGMLDVGSVHPDYEGYYRAYKGFEGYISQTLFSELAVFTGDVCGTLDCVAWIDGKLALIDWKTGQVSDWVKYQLGALASGFMVILDRLNIDLKIDMVLAVQLCPDGQFHVYKSDRVVDLAKDFACIYHGEQPQSDVKLNRLILTDGLDEFIAENIIGQLERRNELLSSVKEYNDLHDNIKFLLRGVEGSYRVGRFKVTCTNKKRGHEVRINLIDQL